MGAHKQYAAVDKQCRYCKADFRCETAYDIKHKKFCSRACNNKERGDARIVKRVERLCKTCGDVMSLLPCHLTTKWYCSVKCRSADPEWRESRAGENGPMWTGGSGTYWKRKARERDGKCLKCGREADGKELHAHHILPIAAGGEHSLVNLASVCNDCHQTVEADFWRRLLKRIDPKALLEVCAEQKKWLKVRG